MHHSSGGFINETKSQAFKKHSWFKGLCEASVPPGRLNCAPKASKQEALTKFIARKTVKQTGQGP